MPFFPHRSTTSTTTFDGVATIARSTIFGKSLIEGYACTPWMLSLFRIQSQ
jgi:hypothetical protein